jgi:GPI-anchor transamidase subunit GAA1
MTGWSLWSKDIILLLPPDSKTGTQAWADAYHDAHDSSRVTSLPIKSGALQGAIAIDYPFEHRFKSVHIVYDGVNGQLPNLDLINSVVSIAGGQMGFSSTLQGMWTHSNSYSDRLQTVFRGMLNQGLGHATGPHSSFIPYHVDAVTLQPYGDGWQDEMAMGRLIEGTFRSLNNLLEHLHQSFFFYLLMNKDRFVSIGTYLPSAMLIAANFTIMAINFWVKSGQKEQAATPGGKMEKAVANKTEQISPPAAERELFLPVGLVVGCHALGAVPLYLFNHTASGLLATVFLIFAAINCALPHAISTLVTTYYRPSVQQYHLISCVSLLLLGMFLSSLATLNFSLAFLVGLLSSPLSFIRPFPADKAALKWATAGVLSLLAPPAVLYSASTLLGLGVGDVLTEAAFGWDVWAMYTPVVIWCVWWPAWMVGSVVALGSPA